MIGPGNKFHLADQKQWLSWLIRVRIVIITFLLGIELTIQQVARMQDLTVVQVPMKPFLAILVFWYLLDLIHHILLKINTDYMAQSYVQVALDITMVSLVVHFTGGLDSYFYFLYPLTVLVASVILPRSAAYLFAGLAFIQAGIILELPYYQIIPFYGLIQPDLKELQIKILANLAGFMAVAYLASKLAENLRQTGLELKDLQALNQDIIESLRSGLITTDLNGTILLSNTTADEILQVPSSSLEGKPVQEIFPGFSREESDDIAIQRKEFIWNHASGECYLGMTISPLTREGKVVGFVYNFQDVTQLKEMGREIQLKDRMAAVGRMAAGIAHEIRNPLASIAGSVKLFSELVDLKEEEQRLIQIVLKESQRLNKIIDDFLQYSREMTFHFQAVNIPELLNDTLTLLKNDPRFDERYRIETDFPPQPVFASVDPDRIRQVFWNLEDNSLKAMPAGGTIFVRLRKRGPHLQVEFRDTGPGMSPRQIEKIFEPFQSEFDKGTGLGMAISYQIIQAHKGAIAVESRPGGCMFRIELPCLEEDSAGSPRTGPLGKRMAKHHG